MIYKSYLLEKKIKNLKENVALFYGENFGLKQEFKNDIRFFYKDCEILNFYQDEILKDERALEREIKNISLFQKKKIFFLNNVSDKIFDILNQNFENVGVNKIYIFSDILDKKSKIRNFFEKEKNYACVPCYPDNEISIKKIIQEKLSGFDGVSPFILNLIYENTNLDRIKLYNELEKILVCFTNKKIDKESLEVLLNSSTNDNFNLLKDEAIIGNKINTNKYLADTMIEAEKGTYYLNIINQRLINLYQLIKKANTTTLELAVNEAKPPIFWKDKPIYIKQLQKWNSKKLKKILNDTYELEIRLKSNSIINKNLLIKKLILDICVAANS